MIVRFVRVLGVVVRQDLSSRVPASYSTIIGNYLRYSYIIRLSLLKKLAGGLWHCRLATSSFLYLRFLEDRRAHSHTSCSAMC